MGLPAGRAAVVKDDWSSAVLGQFPLDLPYQPLALFLDSLDRLTINQLVHRGAAVTVIVQLGTASVKQMQILVWVWPASRAGEGYDVVLAHDPGKPVGGVNRFELAVDVDLLQLVDQDHCRVPQIWQVAHRYRNLEPVIGSITELLHDLAGFCAVFLDVGTVARQRVQDVSRHAP